MHDRSALGAADVDDEVLAAMVADLLGADDVELVSSTAVPVDYDLPAITTGGRWWVSGTASVAGQDRDFQVFAKHVHQWSRSPFFADVPEQIRPMAAEQVPWRTEGAVYRSDLGDRMPTGLALPRALGVHDIDDLAYSVWLEVVPVATVRWDLDRYLRAAQLLGRFAGRAEIQELAGIGGHEWDVSQYVAGRLHFDVLPRLGSDELWRHPLVAPAFGELRDRLLAAADKVDAFAAELLTLPVLVGQGDACPNNLLVRPDRDGFTLIDFGFFNALPVGFDLGQLLVGEVQLGRATGDDLAQRDAACLASYVDGLAAEGCEVDPAVVARAHALQLVIFSGLSSLPFEHLDEEPTDALRTTAATRATIARHSLALLDRTA